MSPRSSCFSVSAVPLRRARTALLAGLATLLFLTAVCFWDYYPPLVGAQHFSVEFPSAPSIGSAEPLITTGRPGAGDLFYVRYLADQRIVLSYDCWGHGGPSSPPLAIVPGSRHSLVIELPSLAAVPGNIAQASERLRVVFDGTVVLDAKVDFYQRRAQRAYFGRNPLGGTSAGPLFHGQLFYPDGRPHPVDLRTSLTRTDRLLGWLRFGRWQLLAITLISATVAWSLRHRSFSPSLALSLLRPSALRPHRAFILTAAFCSVIFAAMLTSGSFRLIAPESFGNFYDYQAMSLLQGRLDVPEASLQGEAFIYESKTYGYFGVTPALLRLPFVIFGVAFGELSRAAMLLYYVATLVASYLLLLDATRLLRHDRPRPAPWQTLLFTVHVGLGSTVFFLGSRAYIYHEAILCGIMFAVFSCWCALRHLANPTGRWWLAALALGVLSVHARPPTGLFALTVLGCVAATHLFRLSLSQSPSPVPCPPSPVLRPPSPLRPLAIGALAIAGVASFNALSYAKFRTFEGCPLRLNVQYSPTRLAKIDSKQFHFSNVPYGFASYLTRPTVEFSPRFPWLYLGPYLPPIEFPAAKLDLPDRTLALPFGMTGLFVLATVAGAWACFNVPASRAPIITLWAAVVPISLAMFAAIATAERYTGDWIPFLVCAAAFGLAAPVWRPVAAIALTSATIWACALTLAATLHYQGSMVWGVSPEVTQSYQQLRARVDSFFAHPAPNPQ